MKRHLRFLQQAANAMLLALVTTALLPAQAGETPVANSTFDANASGWYWENWSAPGSGASFDATKDSTFVGGPVTSGSLLLTNNFTSVPGYQQAVFTLQLPGATDFTSQIGAVSFDVRVDPSSTPRAGGDYGFLEVILRQGNNWDWVGLPGVRLNGNAWQRVVFNVPKSGVDSIRALTIKLGENDFLGPVSLNIDNIAFTVDPDDVVIWNGNGGVVTDPATAPAGWSWENWSQSGSTVTSDLLDFYGRPTSGSMTLSNNFASPSGYSQAVFTLGLPAPVNAIEEYSSINLDVKVDPISTPRTAGDYGFLEVILRDTSSWTWVSTGPTTGPNAGTGVHLTGTDWQHITMPLRGGGDVRAITLKLGENNLPGPVVLHVDNITWTRADAPPPPPTLSISRVTDNGFYLVANSSYQYERTGIRTLKDDATMDAMSFVDKTAPMTYSFDLLSFPSNPPNDGFQAHIFLVPYIARDNLPDWTETNIIYLDIKANANGGGNATFRWKTNDFGNSTDASGHGIYAPGLSNLTASTVLGTWGITVTDKTNFTVTGPGGATMTVTLPTEVTDRFWTDKDAGLATLNVFFGVQANAEKNIAQRARIGGARVKEGSTVLVEDTFQGPALDDTKWVPAAPAQSIQFVSEPEFHIGWSLPDNGFTGWESSTSLTTPNWSALDLSAFTPLQLGPAKKEITVKNSEMPALPAGENQFYLRMVKPQ